MTSLSVQRSFAGKTLFMSGASGFLGKVWLAMLLDRVSGFRKLYVLMRGKSTRTALERFEQILNESHVFSPLHERHGAGLARFLAERVEILEGDVTKPGLGLSPETTRRVQGEIDLFVNCAGLVDFNPDVRDALAVNVQGTIHVSEFVRGCAHAALLHVSTCYVSGVRNGWVTETLDPTHAPSGELFDAEAEYADVLRAAREIEKAQQTPETTARVEAELTERNRKNGGNGDNPTRLKTLAALIRRRLLKEAMVAEGRRRTEKWGWTDTYTYTKGLAEALLASHAKGLRYSVFRPSIVESSLKYPFPGWNEGFNTSGPLAYLLGSWFRYLPAKSGNPFDVIPVDLVGQGMMIASAALLDGVQAPVYQCGTSDRNLFTINRACELTALSHRKHLRKHGKTWLERRVLSRWDAVPAPANHPLSPRHFRGVVRLLKWTFRRLSGLTGGALSKRFGKAADKLTRSVKKLDQIQEVIGLFRPYTYDHRRKFEARALSRLWVEEAEFRFEPETINWHDFWLNVQMPGLRKWCFPTIEGKKPPVYEPKHPVRLSAAEENSEEARAV